MRDVVTGKDLGDRLKWVKFSGASWSRDGESFYYSRYDAPKGGELKAVNYFHKIYRHKIGTAQSEDELIYERQDQKEWLFGAEVTEDSAYLIITVSQGSDPKKRIFYKDLRQPDAPVIELLNKMDAAYDFLGNDGTLFGSAPT